MESEEEKLGNTGQEYMEEIKCNNERRKEEMSGRNEVCVKKRGGREKREEELGRPTLPWHSKL